MASSLLQRIHQQLLASVTPVSLEGGWGPKGIVVGTIASTMGFGLLQFFAKGGIAGLSQLEWASLKSKQQAPSYVTSTAHALGITYWCFSKILSTSNGGECINVIPVSLGYFINDFFQESVLHQQTDAATIFHHVSSILLLASGYQAPTPVTIFLPHVYIVEISTIFLNLMWFLRSLKMESHPSFRWVMILFALSFFLFRNIHFPYVVTQVFGKYPEFEKARNWFGWRMYGLYLLIGLNVYWFAKILKKIIKS